MAPLSYTLATLLALSAAGFASLIVESKRQDTATCASLNQRKAWHTLTNDEKLEYLQAEVCLMSGNATNPLLNHSRNYFDQLQENHAVQAEVVHTVGAFLPYHRLLMYTHEQLLKSECGYTGYQPYWYEQGDAGNFSNSIVWDTVYGFGGNGRENDSCITTGYFANYTNVIGPSHEFTEHCITRAFSDEQSAQTSQENIDACDAYNTFEDAWPCMENAPHAGGHGGVGAEMGNPISSPGDPVFYLHHTFLDKVWWDWQAKNLSSRLYDMSGNNVQVTGTGFSEIPGPTKRYFDILKRDGDPGNVTTLNHILNMYDIVPNRTIEEVMDIRNEFLCYEYVDVE